MSEITHEDARDPAFGPGFFRAFQVTATVYLPRGAPLPEMAFQWFEMVNTMGTSLNNVVEIRYPLCEDIVEMRRQRGVGPIYS